MWKFEQCMEHFLRGCNMPIIPLPDPLNPFKSGGVDISLAIGWGFPGGDSIKAVSVLGMLWNAYERGKLERVHTFIEATSGNTGMAELTFGREEPFNVPNATFVVQPDLAVGK